MTCTKWSDPYIPSLYIIRPTTHLISCSSHGYRNNFIPNSLWSMNSPYNDL
jgi:hypothetical protein